MMTLKGIKEALRDGEYAWPGGYQRVFIMADGEIASFAGVSGEWREICRATLGGRRDKQWCVAACEVFWEGAPEQCAITGEWIYSAYGDPEGEDQ
jgi:hypothetical protein